MLLVSHALKCDTPLNKHKYPFGRINIRQENLITQPTLQSKAQNVTRTTLNTPTFYPIIIMQGNIGYYLHK